MRKDEVLSTANICRVFMAAKLTSDDHPSGKFVTVRGYREPDVTFDYIRLALHRRQIREMLTQLPAQFHAESESDIDVFDAGINSPWADTPTRESLLRAIERLVQLGIAIDSLPYLAWPPRMRDGRPSEITSVKVSV